MINAQIKKPQGIENIIGSYSPQTIEKSHNPGFTKDPTLQKLIKTYERTLEHPWGNHLTFIEDEYSKIKNEILPKHINSVLQATANYEKNFVDLQVTGFFITTLLQKSYDAGHNNFALTTINLEDIDRIGYGLKGREEYPIKITIIGNIGHSCGEESENSEFKIDGNAGSDLGSYAKNSEFSIYGDTGDHLGGWAEQSKFEVREKTEEYCGYEARNSEFKTPNKGTKNVFLQHIPKSNRIIYTHKDGTEETIRDYDD